MKPGLYEHPAGGKLVPLLLSLMVAGAVAWVVLRPRQSDNIPGAQPIALTGNTMGGTWSLKLPQLPPGHTPEQLQTSCQTILDHLEAEMSTYRADSDVSRFNRYDGADWFAVSPDLVEIVLKAREVSEQTAGAFDITIAPCVDLWGFGPPTTGLRAGKIPPDDAIDRARAHVGYQRLHARANPPALRKEDTAIRIDLSAIAKGFAAKRLAQTLDALGVADYLIAVGGELHAKGVSPAGHPWRVGIEVPTPDTRRILRQIELRDAGVSTSGDYRNFFDIAGQRFSHEIDPHTGRPITSALASVSVVHPGSAYADAMATALMVLGPKEGYQRAAAMHLPALFVTRGDRAFDIHATPEMHKLLVAPPASDSPVTSAP
jgi:thiamine biosynthesis lipoprotein